MTDESSPAAAWLDMLNRYWGGLAPRTLQQPILPGWTFAINNVNSSAPQTEADIVARHSYGRQLGRISDVLALLLQDRDDLATKAPVVDFEKMKADIDKTKAQAAGDRLEAIRDDLRTLKDDAPERYQELRAALRRALDETS